MNRKNFESACKSKYPVNEMFDCDCLLTNYDKIRDSLVLAYQSGKRINPNIFKSKSIKQACDQGKYIVINGPYDQQEIRSFSRKVRHSFEPCELLKTHAAGKPLPPIQKDPFSEPDLSYMEFKLYQSSACIDKKKTTDFFYKEGKRFYGFLKKDVKSRINEHQYCSCFGAYVTNKIIDRAEYGSQFIEREYSNASLKCQK